MGVRSAEETSKIVRGLRAEKLRAEHRLSICKSLKSSCFVRTGSLECIFYSNPIAIVYI